jgi:mannan endo-1,4-beta-mannosidase
MGGIGQYLAWDKKQRPEDFFTDPRLIAAFEKHIDVVLNRVNPLTGLAYKNDPTIMAWENCNMCGLVSLLTGGSPASLRQVSNWVEKIGEHIKSIDKKHLYLDTSGIFRSYPKVLDDKSVDLATLEYYPHWDKIFGGKQITTAETFRRDAATVSGHGKLYIVNEFGWDATDWPTRADLQKVLDTLVQDKSIFGDDFWALQAHAANYGWQSIPANVNNAAYARTGESGQWWALYYGGINTLINSRGDMQARAEMLRNHAYAMAGIPIPRYPVPPAPLITIKGLGVIAWRGSAGAVRYSVQRQVSPTAPWRTICNECATDADTPWVDPKPLGLFRARYRVIAYNADGVASKASAPR